MKTYMEGTREEVRDPDMTAGRVYEGTIDIESGLEPMNGTVTASRPKGLRQKTYKTEACKFYHPYNTSELDVIKNSQLPNQLDRVDAQATYTAMMTDTLLEE